MGCKEIRSEYFFPEHLRVQRIWRRKKVVVFFLKEVKNCRACFSSLGQNGEPLGMGRSTAKVDSIGGRMVMTVNVVLTANELGLSGAGTSCKLSFNTRSLAGWEALAWFQWDKDYISMYIKTAGFLKSFLQVLPGFAGQVPDAFVEKYPGASYTKQTWKPFKASNLSGVYMIRWIGMIPFA